MNLSSMVGKELLAIKWLFIDVPEKRGKDLALLHKNERYVHLEGACQHR